MSTVSVSSSKSSSRQRQQVSCGVCGNTVHEHDAQSSDLLHADFHRLIKKRGVTLDIPIDVCEDCMNEFRSEFILRAMRDGDRQISKLEESVARSIEEQEMVAQNINKQYEKRLRFGDRLSDIIAEFGGSWSFILAFGFFLLAWMVVNSILLFKSPFDPYPYILLNLILSTLAAIQAPVIMMSQNRQEERDRLRAESDYKVNLKAELEIQHLNQKLNFLIKKQWQKLLEIQKMQMEQMKHGSCERR